MPPTRASIIVVTYRREQVMIDTLRSILGQMQDNDELIVVDQTESHSPDVTHSLASLDASEPRLTVYSVDPPSTAAARNFGVKHAHSDLIVFFDDDVILRENCLASHIACHLSHPDVGGVVGRVEHPGQAISDHLYSMDKFGKEYGGFNWETAGPAVTLNGANMSYKRRALDDAGEWDPSYVGNGWREESDLALRVERSGWALRFEPTAHLLHLANAQGGARAYGSDYYDSPAIYQNETLFFLRRFGYRSLPSMTVRLARRGVLRRSAITQHRVARRSRALVTGVVLGVRRYRNPATLESTVRSESSRGAS